MRRAVHFSGFLLSLVLCAGASGAGCDENFNDIYLGPLGGASGAGQAGAGSGGSAGEGGSAGKGQGGAGSGGSAGASGQGGAGSGGKAGAAGAGAAGSAGGCQASCQGKARQECVDGVLKTAETCQVDCSAGVCLKVEDLSAGESSVCARLSDGSLRCWGDNSQGQLGSGSLSDPVVQPRPVPLDDPALEVRLGDQHACARTSKGEVWCWGRDDQGQVGDGVSGAGKMTLAPTKVTLPAKAQALALGSAHSCALLDDTKIVCWGDGRLGQLGDGVATSDHSAVAPAEVQKLPSGVSAIAAGGNRSCVVASGDAVWCWGEEPLDESAQGASLLDPTQVKSATNVTRLSVGPRHACANQSFGTVKCWGADQSGQLGDGTPGAGSAEAVSLKKSSPSGPVPVGTADGIAVGARHGCLIQALSKSLLCWGANDAMQLGAAGDASALAKALAGDPWPDTSTLVAGGKFTCGALNLGLEVRCFGANERGQLGRGGTSAAEGPGAVVW